MELALFDFDHTVTTCDTYGRFLRRVATAEQLAQAWWKVGPWLAAYRLKLISAERIRARVTRLTFSDRHSDDIATLAAGSRVSSCPTWYARKCWSRSAGTRNSSTPW